MIPFNKNTIARSFSLVAPRYDAAAFIQKAVGERLLERLALLKTPPKTILDIGAGTGSLTQVLQKKYPTSDVLGIDLAHGMMQFAEQQQPWQPWKKKPRYACGDAERLPLRTHSIDLIFSNLTFQWCTSLAQVFAECKRVLKPHGALFFATLGPHTLQELRNSWQNVDDFTHVNTFIDMHDIGDSLLNAQIAAPVIDMEMVTVQYARVRDLLHDLKATGAHNMHSLRPKGCAGKTRFARMLKTYETFKDTEKSTYPATFEVIYGHAWQSDTTLFRQDEQGIVRIPADKIPLLKNLP